MTYQERLDLLKLLAVVEEMQKSDAMCHCGRYYRLMFDAPTKDLVAKVRAAVEAEPNATRFTYLEVK